MAIKFRGLVAPVEVPTGDGRMFAAGKLTHRNVPVPLLVRFSSGGHDGAVVVGRIDRFYDGPGGYWAEGEFLDPEQVPEVTKAIYMIQNKLMGPSVDLDRDFTVEAVAHPLRKDKKAGLFKEYNVIGVTLVPMPAFPQVHLSVEQEPVRTLLASSGIDMDQIPLFFDVNAESWKTWPIAPREYKFDADDAVRRIAAWAGIGSRDADVGKYASAFLWRDGNQVGPTLAQDSFRLPLADIINGEPHLIYHAAYSAAALLSGGHGGLPNIPDADKQQMVPVINEIYGVLADRFQDPNLTSPFMEGGGRKPSQMAVDDVAADDECGCEDTHPEAVFAAPPTGIVGENTTTGYTQIGATNAEGGSMNGHDTFANGGVLTLSTTNNMDSLTINFGHGAPSVTEYRTGGGKMDKPYGNVKYADPGYQGDGTARYPIDTPEHVRAAWAYINMPKNAAEYSPEDLKRVKARIVAAAKEHGIEISDEAAGETAMGMARPDAPSLLASLGPLAPPASAFEAPRFTAPTRLTVTDDGRVFGHLAQWKVCHIGVGNRCVIAPKTRTNYQLFRVGTVVCDDGSTVDVGKITLGTGHAHAQWGVIPSREHYDNTGWAAAIVNVGEDRFGIWVAGTLTTNMTPERVAELRQSPLSGDWREVNGNLELIAALAVNNPGFPVYREQDGRAFSLVAAGVVDFDQNEEGESMSSLADVPADDVIDDASELSLRQQRLAEIEQDLNDHFQAKRIQQLAAIDAERQQIQTPIAAHAPANAGPGAAPGSAPMTGEVPELGSDTPEGTLLWRQLSTTYKRVVEPDAPVDDDEDAAAFQGQTVTRK